MAKRGRKSKPPDLHVVNGTHRADRHGDEPDEGTQEPSEDLQPPKKLTKTQQALWDRYIVPATWLTRFDEPAAYTWCCLQAEFDRRPAAMIASRIAQLRALRSELGLNYVNARIKKPKPPDNPNGKYFQD